VTAVTYAFEGFELSPARRVLQRDGKELAITPRAFDLLVALVERAGQVVTKNQLLDLVWPKVVVEENNLAVQLSTLRKLLAARSSRPCRVVVIASRRRWKCVTRGRAARRQYPRALKHRRSRTARTARGGKTRRPRRGPEAARRPAEYEALRHAGRPVGRGQDQPRARRRGALAGAQRLGRSIGVDARRPGCSAIARALGVHLTDANPSRSSCAR